MKSQQTSYTIGLVFHNDASYLRRCLHSLIEATRELPPAEVVFVNNASSDESANCIDKALKEILPFRMLVQKENHLGKARQLLIDNCQTEWLYMTDPDCFEHIQALPILNRKRMEVSGLTNPVVAGVGGGNRPALSNRIGEFIFRLKSIAGRWFPSSQIDVRPDWCSMDHLSTCNAFFHVGKVKSAGGFSPAFSRVGEDLCLGFALNEAGYQLLFNGSAAVFEEPPKNFTRWLKKVYLYGKAQGLVAVFQPRIWRTKKIMPLGILIFEVALFVSYPPLALILFCIWFGANLWMGGLIRHAGFSAFLILSQVVYAAGGVVGLAAGLQKRITFAAAEPASINPACTASAGK